MCDCVYQRLVRAWESYGPLEMVGFIGLYGAVHTVYPTTNDIHTYLIARLHTNGNKK